MDFDFANYLRAITYNARFVRNGEYVFDAVMFGGIVGVYTGVKEGSFSISENQREMDQSTYKGLVENLALAFLGYNEISWAIRDALTNLHTFNDAKGQLASQKISAVGYITLAGIERDEGVVISRDRFGSANLNQLDSSSGKWFVVQTNNDHWDSGCYDRCKAATENLEKLGQLEVDSETLRSEVLL
mmetsp:Transcript_11/g.21  ORF Transcript_11/g.21 Transcript_11/m.21 type:complete len:187 (-) Transcript_11:377-937(-)